MGSTPRRLLGAVKRRVRRVFGVGDIPPPAMPAVTDNEPGPAPGHYDDRPKSESTRARINELTRSNEQSDRPVFDPSQRVVVSLTSHGPRLHRCHLAIEAIAQGTVRPAALVLAMSESDARTPLTPELQRLVARGLEIKVVPDRLRVHSKYWGVVSDPERNSHPIVVCDDDQLYPETWLAQLLETARQHPDAVVAHRAHQVVCDSDTEIAPYLRWHPRNSARPALSAFGTGVSGMLLPVELSGVLSQQGEKFLDCAPTADDIWIHSRAVQHGIFTVQVADVPANFEFVPGTQHVGLYLENVHQHANDEQILRCYGPDEIVRMHAEVS